MIFDNAQNIKSPEVAKQANNFIFHTAGKNGSNPVKAFISVLFTVEKTGAKSITGHALSGYPLLFVFHHEAILPPAVCSSCKIQFYWNGPKYIEMGKYQFSDDQVKNGIMIFDLWIIIIESMGGSVGSSAPNDNSQFDIVKFRDMEYEVSESSGNYIIKNMTKGNRLIQPTSPIGQKIINLFKKQLDGSSGEES